MPAGAPATVALRDGSSSGLSQRPMFWVEEAIVAWSWHRIEFLGILILPPKRCIVRRHWRCASAETADHAHARTRQLGRRA